MATKTNTLGWELWHTGGGCMAWRVELDGEAGAYVLATVDGDAQDPIEGQDVLVGYYCDLAPDGVYLTATWAQFADATPAEWGARAKELGTYAFPAPAYEDEAAETTDMCEDCGTRTAYHGGLCPPCIERL
jgi:hypothetical protein